MQKGKQATVHFYKTNNLNHIQRVIGEQDLDIAERQAAWTAHVLYLESTLSWTVLLNQKGNKKEERKGVCPEDLTFLQPPQPKNGQEKKPKCRRMGQQNS